MLSWLRCFWRQRHEPMRHFLGGFRCAVCGLVGADLGVMGFDGYVRAVRVTYARQHGEVAPRL
jgi:hypothetical protein